MKKLRMIALVLSLLPSLSNADCAAVIKAADKLIADQQQQIELYKTEVKSQTDQIASLNVALNAEAASDEAFYKNPFFMIGLGILVGGIGGVYLLHK